MGQPQRTSNTMHLRQSFTRCPHKGNNEASSQKLRWCVRGAELQMDITLERRGDGSRHELASPGRRPIHRTGTPQVDSSVPLDTTRMFQCNRPSDHRRSKCRRRPDIRTPLPRPIRTGWNWYYTPAPAHTKGSRLAAQFDNSPSRTERPDSTRWTNWRGPAGIAVAFPTGIVDNPRKFVPHPTPRHGGIDIPQTEHGIVPGCQHTCWDVADREEMVMAAPDNQRHNGKQHDDSQHM